MSILRIVVSCGVAALVLASGAAFAQGRDEDARVQFQQGIELYKQGDFEQAAVAFSRAYELKPSYKILFNLAQVENELKHYAGALEAYVRYLAAGGAEVPKERIDQVKVEIARLNALVGMVTVKGGPFGSTVFVDDEREGETPLPGPVFVDLGKHMVVVKKDGAEIHREKVQVAGGQKVEVVIEAGRKPAPPPAAAPAPVPLPAAGEELSPGPSPSGRGDQAPENGEGGEFSRVWTWVAFGVGGAAAVGAAVTGGLAISAKNELDGACPDNGCPESRMDDLDAARTLGDVATALTVVAAAGVAAGVVLWFFEPDLTGEGVGGAAVAVMPGGKGLVVEGRF